jgi:hypothetical protein
MGEVGMVMAYEFEIVTHEAEIAGEKEPPSALSPEKLAVGYCPESRGKQAL